MKKRFIFTHHAYLAIYIITVLCHSCITPKEEKIGDSSYITFKIDVNNIKDSCDNILKSAEFIPLEFSENGIINTIDKLIPCEGKLIVFDKRERQVIVFNRQGDLITRIRNSGKGPNQYLFPRDIIYNRNEKK